MLPLIRFLAFSVMAAVPLAGCATSPDPAPSPLSALLAEEVREAGPGVAMAVMQDGKIVFADAVGLASLTHDKAIRPETVFHAASVTKQFTAFAVVTLAAEGQLSLDDDIRTHIPELRYRGPTITVQHLLDHMSGLREASTLMAMSGWQPDGITTERQRLDVIARQTSLNFLPGETFEYSNSGYALLAEIVARISGQSYESYLAETVFQPLGMERTSLRTSLGTIIKDRADPYGPSAEGYSNLPLNFELVGSTGLQTTVLDLMKWSLAINQKTIGTRAAHALFEERTMASDGQGSVFGRGQEMRLYRGLETWSHGGTDQGYKAFLLRVPSENFAIAVLANRSTFDGAKVAFAAVDALLVGSPRPEEPFEPASAEALRSFAGTYELFPGQLLPIATDGEALYLGGTDGPPLPQVGARSFMLDPSRDLTLDFPDADGGPTPTMTFQIGLNGGLQAKRIALAPFEATIVRNTDYLGTYYSPELDMLYHVEEDEGQLVMRHHRLRPAVLTAYQPDTFAGTGAVGRTIFTRDRAGRVVGALMSSPLANDVRFEKVTGLPR